MTRQVTCAEHVARVRQDADRETRIAVQRGRDEMSRFYANQIAYLKEVEFQRDILVTSLQMILAEDVGADRRGKGAKAQVRAVRELLDRLS